MKLSKLIVFLLSLPVVAFGAEFGIEYSPDSIVCPMVEGASINLPKLELRKVGKSGSSILYHFEYQENSKSVPIEMELRTNEVHLQIGRLTGKVYTVSISAEGVLEGSKRKVSFAHNWSSIWDRFGIEGLIYGGSAGCEIVVPPLKPIDQSLNIPGLQSYAVMPLSNATIDFWPLQISNELLKLRYEKITYCSGPRFEISSADGTKRELERVTEVDYSGNSIPVCWESTGEVISIDEKLFAAVGSDRKIYFWQLSDGKLIDQLEIKEIDNKNLSFLRGLAFDVKTNLFWISATTIDHKQNFLISIDARTKKIGFYSDSSYPGQVYALKNSNRLLKVSVDELMSVWDMATGRELMQLEGVRVAIPSNSDELFFVLTGATYKNNKGNLTAYSSNTLKPVWSQPIDMEVDSEMSQGSYARSAPMALVGDRLLLTGFKQLPGPTNWAAKTVAFNAITGIPINLSLDIHTYYDDSQDRWFTPNYSSDGFFLKEIDSHHLFSAAWDGQKHSIEKVWDLSH